jgi:hypothetical protein
MHRIPVLSSIVIAFIFMSSAPTSAASCSAKSGSQITPLLELYTSEGCSSCPPADTWLSGLKTEAFVPLAFHVDYWDYIGWKDRFAKPQFTERQHTAAQNNKATYVYTPQFLLNGEDFRGGSEGRLQQAIKAINQQPPTIALNLTVSDDSEPAPKLVATAASLNKTSIAGVQIFVALYENHLSSQVRAGENSGHELKHDYVVRELFGPYQMPASGQYSQPFSLSPEWKNKAAGAVIFAQSTNGEILQSLRLPFCQ